MTEETREVLIVEDEPLVRMLAIEEFEEIGFTVHAAGDAASALVLLAQVEGLDLLFTDIQMPGVGSSRVDLQACKLEYSIVSPK